MNSQIQILPEHIVNQIKAGEVIERPANIIKEILENSLDAGADDISLHIVDEGLTLISIKDNGKGMSFEELPLAFKRHATSKLQSFEQIYSLNSFGFRGEALASIASVSQIHCQTMTQNQDASSLEINAGEISHHINLENKANIGTELFIKNLFFNTPVRLKFTQSKKSEKRHIEKTIRAFLLSHPNIKISIKWDDQDKQIYQPTDISNRVSQVFYKRSKNPPELLKTYIEYDDIKIRAFISKDSSAGYSYKEQFLFVNGRYFENKALHNTICRNLGLIWPDRNQGHYVLFIETPQHKIDINIHPRKTEVKFQESASLFSLISEMLKKIVNDAPVIHNQENKSSNNYNPTSQNFFSSQSSHFSSRDLKKDYLQSQPELDTNNYIQSLNWDIVQNLSNRFSLLSSPENQFFIVDFYQFALFFINKNTQASNNEATPLLVSEILRLPELSENDLDKLKEKAFELDKLQDSYALRTIPRYLLNLKYQIFIEELVNSILQDKSFEFEFEVSPFSSLNFLNNYLIENLSLLISNKVLMSLSDEKLKKLWT